MKPYYNQGNVAIYHGDCSKILPRLAAEGFAADLCLTDPPYFKSTHDGARKNTKSGPEKLVDFAPINEADTRIAFEIMASITRRWIVSTVDYNAIPVLQRPSSAYKFVRFGVWVKPGAAPQFTGDRPGMGWEAIAFLHRHDWPMSWHGGGRDSVFHHPVVRGAHPTQKPIPLMKELICLFTSPNETVIDPFMGSGSTLRAAKDLGRRVVGIEIDERWCEHAAKRMAQEVLPFYAGSTPTEEPAEL